MTTHGPTCFWCGQRRNMSREHVIAQWVSRVLASDQTRIWPSPVVNARHYDNAGVLMRTFTHSKVVNMVTKRVCKVCNEGWMETNVERPVQPILGPMILGRRTVLDLAAQSRLAAWAAKTAMVARYAESPPLELDRRWLDHMYRNQLAPDSWYVWISKYQGERPVFYESADITLSFPGDIPGTPHGVLTTLVIGYVAFKVLGVNSGTPSDPGPSVMPRLWPISSHPIVWPPEHHIDDSSLPAFVAMYVDQPGQMPQPLPD